MITARSNVSFEEKSKPFKVLVCLVTLVAFFNEFIIYGVKRHKLYERINPERRREAPKPRDLFNRCIALIVLIAFFTTSILTDLAWAVGTPSAPPGGGSDRAGGPGFSSFAKASEGKVKELNPDKFTLPEYLGHIKDSYSTPSSRLQTPNSKLVIHIQDAHCNYAAQHKISEIIEYLNKEYGVDAVNLEGGDKEYDLSIFTGINDKNIRNKVSDYFVKEGLVNGAEYFAINNPEKVSLWGIEDTKLYLDNLNIYRDSLKYKDEVDKHLNALTHILSNLKTKIYSKELLELDNKYSQYKAGTLEFKDYLTCLIQTAKDRAIDIKRLANIFLLSQTLDEEGKVDFKKASNQRDDLVDKLHKKLSKKSLEELVLKTVEFKTEKISQKDFYAYILDKARQKEVVLNDFPELQKYIVYISMYNAIDKTRAMDELERLEDSIKETLFKNDEQKELNRLSKNLAILKNIFNVTLTKDEYQYYIASKESFSAASYIKFINREAPLYKITAQLDKNVTDLDRYREDVVKFYQYSFKRDDEFIKRLKFSQYPIPNTQYKRGVSILITGGFHTENLCEIFKKQNIAYISIMPNFKNCDGYECPYFRLLKGDAVKIEKMIYSTITSLPSSSMAVAALSTALGKEVWGQRNIDAFKAWAGLQTIAVRDGWDINKLVNITKKDNDRLELSLENGKAPITIAISDLFHQAGEVIDKGMAEGEFFPIGPDDAAWPDRVRAIGLALTLGKDVKDGVNNLANGVERDGHALQIQEVTGLPDGQDEHAGGWGVSIRRGLERDKRTEAILHGIIAGFVENHQDVDRIVNAIMRNNISEAQSIFADTGKHKIEDKVTALWDMTSVQRQAIAARRDFAEGGPKKYQTLLSNGIETEQDLSLAMVFIKEVSPSFGRMMIEEIERRGIPVKMTGAKVSNARKSLYSILNRESAYASQINIRKGASVLDVIHEFAHAIPINKLPQPFNSVKNIRVNTDDDIGAIKNTLIQIGMLEEAVAIASEIHLIEDLEKNGLMLSTEDQLSLGPMARGIYNEQSRDVHQLAHAIPQLFPLYQEEYEEYAEKHKEDMKRPIGELMNIPWGDKLEGFGIKVATEMPGQSKVTVDSGELLAGVTNALASDTPENLLSRAFSKIDEAVKKWQQYRRGQHTQKVAPESLQNITFPPYRKKNPKNVSDLLASEKQQTVNRVQICGNFLKFLEKTEEANHEDISKYFNDAIIAAKYLDGDQASTLWRRLYEVARDNIGEKPEMMKKLAFTLLDSGYKQQGEYTLRVYIDADIDSLSLIAGDRNSPMGEFLIELIKYEQIDLVRRVYNDILGKVKSMQEGYRHGLIKCYDDEIIGKFVGQGKSVAEKFIAENSNRHISSEEFHQEIQNLERRGLYQFREHYDWRRVPSYGEEGYFKYLSTLHRVAEKLNEASSELAGKENALALDLKATASSIYDLAIMGSVGRMNLRIKEWEARFGIYYRGDMQEFLRSISAHPEATKEYNFDRYIADEISSVGWSLAREKDFFQKTVNFLKSLPDSNFKLALYEAASRQISPDIQPSDIEAFINDWENTLHVVMRNAAKDYFIESGVFDSVQRRFQILKSWAKDKIDQAEKQLGVSYDEHLTIRNFAKLFRFQNDIGTMTDDNIMEALYEHYGKDLSIFNSLIQMVRGMDTLSQLCLLKRFLWFIPQDAPQIYFQQYIDMINDIIRILGQRKAELRTINLVAADYRQSHLFQAHQYMMAESLLNCRNASLKERGRQRLLALNASSAAVLSPHEYMSLTRDLFGKDKGGTIYTISEFVPAIHKHRKLLDAAERDPENAVNYIREAEALLGAFVFDFENEDPSVIENKLFGLMKMVESYAKNGDISKAEGLFSTVQRYLHQAQVEYKKKLDDFEKLAQAKKQGRGSMADYKLKRNVERVEFWIQDLESRQSALLACYAYGRDRDRSLTRLDEIISSFEREASLRRDRFDVRSIISAASILEDKPELHEYAVRIYNLAIEKLALLRGNKDMFNEGASLVVERIDEGKLSNTEKDILLAKAIKTLVPPKGKRNWIEISETLPGILKLADKAIKEKIYPETEKEVLIVFADLTQETQFDRNDWKNDAKLKGLGVLFDKVAAANPEIAVHENFDILVAMSEESQYRQGLALLHRAQWKDYIGANGQSLTMDAIQSGAVDAEKALNQILKKIDAAIANNDIIALNSALPLLIELINKGITTFLSQQKEKRHSPTIDELRSIPSFVACYQRAEPFLHSINGRTEIQERIIDVLLDGKNIESAKAKYMLYKELLANDKVNIATQRKVFEGLILAGKIDTYAQAFFNEEVLSRQVISEEQFYKWVKRLLVANGDQIPSDILLAYLFQNPSKAEEFFTKYERNKSMQTMNELTHSWDHEAHKALDGFRWGDKGDYGEAHSRIAQKYGVWIPDIFDEIELLLVYESRFAHFRSFDQWIEDIRNWYIHDIFEMGRSEARFGIEVLENKLAKVAPEVKLTGEQRTYLAEFLKAKGGISYSALSQYLGIEFSEEQRKELFLLFNAELEPFTEAVAETMGRPRFDVERKQQLDQVLDTARKNYKARMSKMKEEAVEIPAVFENTPGLIKYALVSYFKQLPFGEREAVLNDFKTEGLTEEQALRKFFEVTGNEKLAQFLSLRRDLIPERYRKELEQFQENVESSSFEEMRSTIEKELGASVDSIFTSINPRPLKVGTIGEVFEVVLKDGTVAIVKVITPSKRKAIERNLARIHAVAMDIDKHKFRFEQKIDVLSMFNEFERTIREELDLRIEYENAKRFKDILPVGISIPVFYEQYVCPSVLVQSYARGRNPLEASVPLKKEVVRKIGAMLIDQVLSRDVYHDDLHPGNIRIDEQGNVALLDFGRIGKLNQDDRKAIIPLLMAFRSKDARQILEACENIADKHSDYNHDGLLVSIKKIAKSDLSLPNMISLVFFECGTYGLEIKGTFLQLLKGILTFEGTAHMLDPEYSLEGHVKSLVLSSVGSFLKGLFPSSDAIGKFIEIEPISMDEQGRLKGIVENIDTKERLDLSGLSQRRAPPAEIDDYIKNIEDLIKDTEMSQPQRALLERFVAAFESNLPRDIIISQQAGAGFFGIGKPGLLVINQDLLTNPLSFLHEIIEYLKHTHPEIVSEMEALLDESGKAWLKQHEEKYQAQGKHDYFIQNREHYVIRAFTRQVFKDTNESLTRQIKGMAGGRKRLIEGLNQVIANWSHHKDINEFDRSRKEFNLMRIHGQLLVDEAGQGVLIFGDSGIGKSQLSIEILDKFKNFRFISDDQILLTIVDGDIYAGTFPLLDNTTIAVRHKGSSPNSFSRETYHVKKGQLYEGFVRVGSILNLSLTNAEAADSKRMTTDSSALINTITSKQWMEDWKLGLKKPGVVSLTDLQVLDVALPQNEETRFQNIKALIDKIASRPRFIKSAVKAAPDAKKLIEERGAVRLLILAQILLIKVLNDYPDPPVYAAQSIGAMFAHNPQGAERLLKKALNNPYESVRKEAARSIGAMFAYNPQGAERLLRKALKYTSEESVSGEAAYSIGAMFAHNPQGAERLLRETFHIYNGDMIAKEEAARSIGAMFAYNPKGAERLLREALASSDVHVHRGATRSIGAMFAHNPKGAEALLKKELEDSDSYIRERAAQSIGAMFAHNPQGAKTLLLKALNDSRDSVQRGAVESIGAMFAHNPIEAEILLCRKLYGPNDPYGSVRKEAARSIGAMFAYNPKGAESLLKEALASSDVHVHRGATRSIGAMFAHNPKGAEALLKKELEDSDSYIRIRAAQSIGAMFAHNPQGAETLLLKALKGSDVFIQNGAIESIGSMFGTFSKEEVEAINRYIKASYPVLEEIEDESIVLGLYYASELSGKDITGSDIENYRSFISGIPDSVLTEEDKAYRKIPLAMLGYMRGDISSFDQSILSDKAAMTKMLSFITSIITNDYDSAIEAINNVKVSTRAMMSLYMSIYSALSGKNIGKDDLNKLKGLLTGANVKGNLEREKQFFIFFINAFSHGRISKDLYTTVFNSADISKDKEMKKFIRYVTMLNVFPDQYRKEYTPDIKDQRTDLVKERAKLIAILTGKLTELLSLNAQEEKALNESLDKFTGYWQDTKLYEYVLIQAAFFTPKGKEALKRLVLGIVKEIKLPDEMHYKAMREGGFKDEFISRWKKEYAKYLQDINPEESEIDLSSVYEQIISHLSMTPEALTALPSKYSQIEGISEAVAGLKAILDALRKNETPDESLVTSVLSFIAQGGAKDIFNKELITDLRNLLPQRIDSKVLKSTPRIRITQDPAIFMRAGIEPSFTCQRCTSKSGFNEDGQLINRILNCQFKICQYLLGNTVVARTFLEVALDNKGEPILLVERIYGHPSLPFDRRQFEREIVAYAASIGIVRIFWAHEPIGVSSAKAAMPALLPVEGSLYRDNFGVANSSYPATQISRKALPPGTGGVSLAVLTEIDLTKSGTLTLTPSHFEALIFGILGFEMTQSEQQERINAVLARLDPNQQKTLLETAENWQIPYGSTEKNAEVRDKVRTALADANQAPSEPLLNIPRFKENIKRAAYEAARQVYSGNILVELSGSLSYLSEAKDIDWSDIGDIDMLIYTDSRDSDAIKLKEKFAKQFIETANRYGIIISGDTDSLKVIIAGQIHQLDYAVETKEYIYSYGVPNSEYYGDPDMINRDRLRKNFKKEPFIGMARNIATGIYKRAGIPPYTAFKKLSGLAYMVGDIAIAERALGLYRDFRDEKYEGKSNVQDEFESIVTQLTPSLSNINNIPDVFPKMNIAGQEAASTAGLGGAKLIGVVNGKKLWALPNVLEKNVLLDDIVRGRDRVAEIGAFGLTKETPDGAVIVDLVIPEKIFDMEGFSLEERETKLYKLIGSKGLRLALDGENIILINDRNERLDLNSTGLWILEKHLSRLTDIKKEILSDYGTLRNYIKERGEITLESDWDIVIAGRSVDFRPGYLAKLREQADRLDADIGFATHHHPHLAGLAELALGDKPLSAREEYYEARLKPSGEDLDVLRKLNIQWFEIRVFGSPENITDKHIITNRIYNTSDFDGERSAIISELIPLVRGPVIDRTGLIKAMKEKIAALIGEDQSKGPAVIRSILSAISDLEQPVRSELQMALRTAIMVDGLGSIDKTGHVNIVAQIANIGKSNKARGPIQDIKGKLEMYPYNLYAQSIIGEGINSEDELKEFINLIIKSVKDPANKDPQALLLLPEHLHNYFEQAKNHFKANGIDIDKPGAHVKIQKIEQGDAPDLVTQFGLGFEILEYVRQGEKAEPSQYLLNLVAAMVDSDIDPRAILNELFKTVLKIRRIDWGMIDEQRRAWEAVATAL